MTFLGSLKDRMDIRELYGETWGWKGGDAGEGYMGFEAYGWGEKG